MKLFLNVCALVLVGGFAAGTLPAFADAAADAARGTCGLAAAVRA